MRAPSLTRAKALVLVLIAACAPRHDLRIEPHLATGDNLRYRFAADVRTVLAQDRTDTVTSTLEGIVEVHVLDATAAGTTLRIRFEPTASSRDGVRTNPGPAQERTVHLQANGTVEAEPAPSDRLGDADLDPDALATLLLPDVPHGSLGPGRSWTNGGATGRFVSLARDDGRSLARLDLTRERFVSVERILDGRPIDLDGTERARTVLLWNLDSGNPASAEIHAVARLDVRAGAQHGGVITIDARTRLDAI